MEIGIAIIGLIVLTATFLPFIIVHRNKGKRENEFLERLNWLAKTQASEIKDWDTTMELGIGLSADRQYVFFLRKKENQLSEQRVDLNTIQKCVANTIRRSVNTKAGKDSIIEKLELVFVPIHPTKDTIRLEFFHSNESLQIYEEYNLLKKWEKTLQEVLTTRKAEQYLTSIA